MPAHPALKDGAWAGSFHRRRRESGLVAEFHDRLRGKVREAAAPASPPRSAAAEAVARAEGTTGQSSARTPSSSPPAGA
ncbi:hypothetical protein [Streptomyces sp. NRRL F-4474]|uniref:hypothetical protein n=1 Tax=Streptomyces sp. NRRL F-4474 TaxID=1463851 RepID=UPI000AAC140D|nr:hypothetical protein [Streptomyces sp. NRRL F-4474]